MSKTNSVSLVSMTVLQSKLMSYTPDGYQFPLSNTIGLFLEILGEDQWNDMAQGINAFINDEQTDPTGMLYPDLRVVVTLADGTVVIDTFADSTFAKYTTNSINENHNSRLAILTALMSNAGTGFEKKYSSTVGNDKVYYYYASRMGSSAQNALGVVRVSAYNYGNNDGSRGDDNGIKYTLVMVLKKQGMPSLVKYKRFISGLVNISNNRSFYMSSENNLILNKLFTYLGTTDNNKFIITEYTRDTFNTYFLNYYYQLIEFDSNTREQDDVGVFTTDFTNGTLLRMKKNRFFVEFIGMIHIIRMMMTIFH